MIIAVVEVILSALSFIWGLIWTWLLIFFAPFKDWSMLWILVPIYLSWFFAEFFQEKKSTDFGNAISNGVVALWVGVDWVRYLFENYVKFSADLVIKLLLSLFTFSYGLVVIIYGIKTKRFIHYMGRVRNITYVMLMVTPMIYGVTPITLKNILVILLFFPAFYYIIELFDRFTPTPETYKEAESEGSSQGLGGEIPGAAEGGLGEELGGGADLGELKV